MIIFSDIHGNLPALLEFFKNVDPSEKKVCLGDIIGYGASPSECLKLVRENNVTAIKGNHERALLEPEYRLMFSYLARNALEWTEKQLRSDDIDYICTLPEYLFKDRTLFVHGSPVELGTYIDNRQKVEEAFTRTEEMHASLCFFGHTHIPGFYDHAGVFHYEIEKDFVLRADESYLINPGSIGQPRDGKTELSYCTWNAEKHVLRFHRVRYDITLAADKIRKAGLPNMLADRLFIGR